MKIFLIGYMGCGKSTVGKILSQLLNFGFIDFDRYIENATGKTISHIFENEGEEKFRELEKKYLEEICSLNNVVISLGGGTPCFFNNIDRINKHGISVYLEMSVDSLVKRLSKAKRKRPLIQGMNSVDLKYFIEANLEKRKPVYTQAHHIIDSENKTPEELAELILGKINK